MELHRGRNRLGVRKRFFAFGWALEWTPQSSGHSTELLEFKKHVDVVLRLRV